MKGTSIIFENDDFLAVNKEAGLLTIPDRYDETRDSLYKILSRLYTKIFIVHRLDRDTSGLMLFAKNESTHKYLSQLFEQRNIIKKYLGIVRGSMPEKTGVITERISEHPEKIGVMTVSKKGKISVTNYEVLEDFGIYSLVQFEIQSGRTHQIRVHTKFIGYPIICDAVYGDGKAVLLSSFKKKYKLSENEPEEKPLISRLGLHSHSLQFKDINGKDFFIEAPLPKDMKALLQQLRKNRR